MRLRCLVRFALCEAAKSKSKLPRVGQPVLISSQIYNFDALVRSVEGAPHWAAILEEEREALRADAVPHPRRVI